MRPALYFKKGESKDLHQMQEQILGRVLGTGNQRQEQGRQLEARQEGAVGRELNRGAPESPYNIN